MADDITKFKPMDMIGSSGLTRFGGYVQEEWLPELQGQRGIKIYKEMRDNDPIVGAILFVIKMLSRQVDWEVEAGGETAQDKEAQKFLEECMEDMSMTFNDVISEVFSMLPFGWAWLEICYKKRLGPGQKDGSMRSKFTDGKIGWRKLPLRAQETFWQWVFGEDGSVMAMQQMASPDYKLRVIPIEKSLLFRTEVHKNNPEGRSLLRNAYRPWYFKKNIEEVEGIGVERDLAGLPMVQVPPEILSPDASPEAKAMVTSMLSLVTSVRRDKAEGIVFPSETTVDGKSSGYKFSLLSTGSRRTFDTNVIIERYSKQIAMTVLADFIMLGQQGVGSFALSSDKTNMFSTALGSLLDMVADVFNNYAIPRLMMLNTFDGLTAYPKLKHGDMESPDLSQLGTYLAAMSGAQMLTPDAELENFLRKLANLPEREEGAPMPSPEAGQQGKGEKGTSEDGAGGAKAKPPIGSVAAKKSPKVAESLTKSEELFMGAIQELRDAITKSYEDDIEKFNPYHDRLGRFSSANGAHSVTNRDGSGYKTNLAMAARGHDVRSDVAIHPSAQSGKKQVAPPSEKKEKDIKKIPKFESNAKADDAWDVANGSSKLFGKEMSPEQIAVAAGAYNKLADFRVSYNRHGEELRVKSLDGSGKVTMTRIISKKEMHMDYFRVSPGHEGQDIGTQMFATAVKGAQSLGIPKITTYAAGMGNGTDRVTGGEFNGYYTWARLGYNQKLGTAQVDRLRDGMRREGIDPSKYAKVTDVRGMMKTPEGRKLWKRYGSTMQNATFNTRPNSASMKVLNAYLKEKGIEY